MCGCGCKGDSTSRNLRIGGQLVGVAEIDKIIGKALESSETSEDRLKAILVREVKLYNYVPPAMEKEYSEALWKEYLRARSSRK